MSPKVETNVKVPFSFRGNPASTPKTPTKTEDASLISTSNVSSTIKKMQPRDFGMRVTNYNPEKQNTLNGVSFAKLDELQTLNINKESGIVQKII